MTTYYGQAGAKYILEGQLGVGGEGIVYSLYGNKDRVAKIYKSGKFQNVTDIKTMERKLKAMISMEVPIYIGRIIRLAWPQDILYDDGGMIGFIMPKIDSRYKIYDVYRGGDNAKREQVYPDYTWKYSIQFAYHLSWIVSYLHSHNIVIGDFNQNNIVVDTANNTIILIDCDSFDITDFHTGEHFPCTVGLPEMLAPELQDVGSLTKGTFSKESDNFSLAIHIFRLLMNNADPFGGIITTDGSTSLSSIPANYAILNGACAYVRDIPNKIIPDWSPKMEIVPVEFRSLFDKTFNYTTLTAKKRINSRATAAEWCFTLEPFGTPEPNHRLKRCSHNRLHVYAAHNNRCPWCKKSQPNANINRTKSTFSLRAIIFIILVILTGLCLLGINSIPTTKKWFGDSRTTSQGDAAQNSTGFNSSNGAGSESISHEYVIFDSDSRYITESDLELLSKEDVVLARNEIFARYGRKFNTEWIRNYFKSKSRYTEVYSSEEFDAIVDRVFNEYERANILTIVSYEEK